MVKLDKVCKSLVEVWEILKVSRGDYTDNETISHCIIFIRIGICLY